MIIRFNNDYLENILQDLPVKGKPKYDIHVIQKFKKVIKILQKMPNLVSLKNLNSLNFEPLKGKLKGMYSVRVDYHYRLIFSIETETIEVLEIIIIEDLTNHYQ